MSYNVDTPSAMKALWGDNIDAEYPGCKARKALMSRLTIGRESAWNELLTAKEMGYIKFLNFPNDVVLTESGKEFLAQLAISSQD